MGLGNKLNKFNFGDTDLAREGVAADGDPRDDEGGGDGFGSVSCSICLETVAKEGDRAWANLQCGHLFHLDCIGSAFNAKGVMQCPNCRKVEKGQWLYANGCRSQSHPDFNVEDWVHEEEFFDIGAYSEVAFGVHWCPFGSSARLPSFEDGDFSPSSYHGLLGQQGYFTEPAPPSAGSHPCPYVTYIGPVHSISSSTGGAAESSSFTWNTGSSVSSEVPTPPYGFPVDPHFHGWDYHSPPPPPSQHFSVSGPSQPTPPPAVSAARTSRDVIRPRQPQFMLPSYHGHSSSGRAGSSVASVPRTTPPFPGSNARTRDRTQALQAYYQQQSTAQSHQPDSPVVVSRGPVYQSGRRPGMGSASSSSSDQAGGSGFLRFNIWEREPYMPLQQAYPVNQMEREPSIWTSSFSEGPGSFHQRHGGGGGSS